VLGGCASSAGIAPLARVVDPSSLGLAAAARPDPSAVADWNGVPAAWWRDFGDAALTQLVERALDGQPSLRVAQARVTRAQAVADSIHAAEGLQVNAGADVTRERFSATSIYPPPLGGSIRTLANAQLSASWEFDAFGRTRSALDAAVGAERAAEADLQAARSALASSVARTYVQLARLQAQREVSERAIRQREELLALTRERASAGLDTQVEVRIGEGAVPDARQQTESLDEQIGVARRALAALCGQGPSAQDRLVARLGTLQSVRLPERLPADLLGRRADIAAARWRVEAASGEVASAKASFYPNINLGAFAGLSSIGLDRLLRSASEQYGAGPALRLPIFDAGRLRANLRGKTADLDAAIETYNGSLIEALHEVADQLGGLQAVSRQQADQGRSQAAVDAAFDLASQRQRAGLTGRISVLNAETAVLAQRRLALDLQARSLEGRIGLIRALGGGYADPAAPASLPALPTPLATLPLPSLHR
jgi:NodT family efflux transporter outer membrane factor (OMF) lipoprotein